AVEMALGEPGYDLVLMDINLGRGIDGTEAAERIVRERDVPILFLSSHTEPEVVEKTERISSYGYVVKSSTPTVLVASIKMAFKLHAAKQSVIDAERIIQHERDNLEAIMAASPVGIIVIDQELVVIRANAAAEQISRQPLSDMQDPRCGDFLGCVNRFVNPRVCGHTEHCAMCTLNKHIITTLNDRVTIAQQDAEFVVEHDGTREERLFRYSTAPVTINGDPSVLVTLEDVTSIRAAAERSRLLSTIADSESIVIFITDANRKTLWMNEAGVRLTGYPLEEMLGKNPGELLQGETPDLELKAQLTAALNAGDAIRTDILNYTKDGRAYWISMDIEPVRDEQGAVTHFVAIEYDVTERRIFEQKLISQDRRVQAIVDRTSDGIVILDRNGVVEYCNPAYERLTGYSAEEERGRAPTAIFALLHPDDVNFIFEHTYAALDQRAPGMIYRYRFLTGEGRYIWREDRVICFYDQDGALEQSYVFARDISDFHPTEASFRLVD
ncbi:MAG: PAS domain S-box protein, partial [Spirochaetaceae bacterium]